MKSRPSLGARRVSSPLAIALALFAAACGGSSGGPAVNSAFSSTWQNDQGASIAALEAKLRNQPPVTTPAAAVGVGTGVIVGARLPSGTAWSYPGRADTLPVIAGPLVLFSSGGKLTALETATGKPAWQLDIGELKLRGAGDDGTTTVVVVANESPRRSRFLAVSRDGGVHVSLESEADLGVPAAQSGYGFVPWNGQYVSVVELGSGRESARLLTRELVTQARNFGGELWFGEKGLIRFDERIKLASTNQATRIALPLRELPGKPIWLDSGNQLTTLPGSARLRIRLNATPTGQGGEVHFTNHAYLASYFRVVLGLTDQDSSLRFARSFAADALGASAGQRGFAVCDGSGQVTLLSENGGDAGALALGARLEACVVESSSASFDETRAAPPLSEQLGSALAELTPDMAAAQTLLVSELGKLQDPRVSKTLIDLTTSARIPPELRLGARRLLSTRRSGKEYMLAALERHYDFVSDVLLPPPVGPLADALAAMKEPAAAPLLARHLNDPANDMVDVEHAALALGSLATPREFEELRTFFSLYRATADEPSLVSAVVAVGGALVRVGGENGRALVQRAADDPLTQSDVRRGLGALFPDKAESAAASNAAGAK